MAPEAGWKKLMVLFLASVMYMPPSPSPHLLSYRVEVIVMHMTYDTATTGVGVGDGGDRSHFFSADAQNKVSESEYAPY